MASAAAAGRQDYVLRTLRKAVQLHSTRRVNSLGPEPKRNSAPNAGILQRNAAASQRSAPHTSTQPASIPGSQFSASQPDMSQSLLPADSQQATVGPPDSTLPGYEFPASQAKSQQLPAHKTQFGTYDPNGSSISTQTPQSGSMDFSLSQASAYVSQPLTSLGSQQLWPPATQNVPSQSVLSGPADASQNMQQLRAPPTPVPFLQQAAQGTLLGTPAQPRAAAPILPAQPLSAATVMPAQARAAAPGTPAQPCTAVPGTPAQPCAPAPATPALPSMAMAGTPSQPSAALAPTPAQPQAATTQAAMPDVASAAAALAAALAGMSGNAKVTTAAAAVPSPARENAHHRKREEQPAASGRDESARRQPRRRHESLSPPRNSPPRKRRRMRQKGPPSPSPVPPSRTTSSTHSSMSLVLGPSETTDRSSSFSCFTNSTALEWSLAAASSKALSGVRCDLQRMMEEHSSGTNRLKEGAHRFMTLAKQYRDLCRSNDEVVDALAEAVEAAMASVQRPRNGMITGAISSTSLWGGRLPLAALHATSSSTSWSALSAAGERPIAQGMQALRRPRRLIDGLAAPAIRW